MEWDPTCAARAWKLKAPAYGLNNAPAAFRRSLKRYLLNSELHMKCVGQRCQASTFGPCLFFVCRYQGQAVIDDISGCGGPDVLLKIRGFSEQRSGTTKLQETSFAHVGMEMKQGASFSATLAQEGSAKNLQP